MATACHELIMSNASQEEDDILIWVIDKALHCGKDLEDTYYLTCCNILIYNRLRLVSEYNILFALQ